MPLKNLWSRRRLAGRLAVGEERPSPATQRSLQAIRCEVVPSSLMVGLTDPFMIPYALALGADAFQVGLLSPVRNFILSLVQLKSADGERAFSACLISRSGRSLPPEIVARAFFLKIP